MSIEFVFLYINTIIANPTLTSAAATIMIKNTKICAPEAIAPLNAFADAMCILENAINKRFTELSMSSMHINTMMELRRVSAPIIPIQNNATDKNI